MSELKLNDVDVDGAIRESAEHARNEVISEGGEGDTRLDFFKKAGVAGGAVVGGGALLGALVPGTAVAGKRKGGGRPPRSFGKGDIGILNYALTLEYLESAFYNRAKRNLDGSVDPQTQVFLDVVVRDERAHVQGLRAALGRDAVKKPEFDFGSANESEGAFLETAFALENTGVSAYLGQALNIKDAGIAAVALSIVTIEARHSGVVGLLLKNSPEGIAPDGPYDVPFSARKVLKIVEGTGFIQA